MAAPWERYGQAPPAPQASPQFPSTIRGPAKQVDPMEAERLNMERERLRMSQGGEARANTGQVLQQSNQSFDNTGKLRSEFIGLPEVKNFQAVLPLVSNAMKLAQRPDTQQSGADDLNIIYAMGKIMDPGSVVREGELALASGTGSFAENWEGALQKLRTGAPLPAEVRRRLVETMRSRGIEIARSYNQSRDNYKFLSENQGYDPSNVVGLHPAAPFQQAEANFSGQPIRNRDGSMGAMPAAPNPNAVFTPQGGQQGAGAPQSPQTPGGRFSAGPDGWVRGEQEYNLTPEVRQQVEARAQAMIREGATYEQVAELMVRNGLSFQEAPLREATELGRGIVTSGTAGPEGLVKGVMAPIDWAAQKAEGAVNSVFGTEFDGASKAASERDAYFAANPYDKGAETAGNILSVAGLTLPFGPVVGGAAGGVLSGQSDTVAGAALDAGIGAVGGKVADLAIRGVAGALAPRVRSEVRRLADEGVTMTPGQMAGRRSPLRRVEERATSLPGSGGAAIEAARDRSVIEFNRAGANRALKPIGRAVPRNVEPGNDTIAFVERELGNNYNRLLSRAQISLDMSWARRVASVRRRANLPAAQQQQFDEILAREVTTTFGRSRGGAPFATGAAYKQFDEKMGKVAAGYMKSDDPYVRDLGEALANVRDQTAAQLRRQNPTIAKELKNTDLGYAQFKRIQAAAAGTPDGIYTPRQLGTAVRQKDRSKDKGAVARGDALLKDLSKDGTAVLPSTVGNSGTADRQMTLDPRAWALGMGVKGLYGPGAQDTLNAFLLAPRSPAAELGANALRKLPAGSIGGIGAGMLLPPTGQ